ncbi:probable G-protein coupled receptor 160 [Scophthalmus maximus]|uniref:probable G-protein coupled receptor 160 n=1 Tax=Scophthalmus maximus TaxID=52904 RepID=UPI001FA8BE2E|nr:probable G-protein coupled receptor 160 [Scophthalmus maximus]XP_035489036.2 probable G-protein coupled receptor 160 [Scophthalmus maximus]
MILSIPSILLGLGGKCLLNWALVFLQRSHVCKSFVGIFGVSLSVVDTAAILIFATITVHSDGGVLLSDLQLTRYHVCLLAQILGQVYGALQWPVVVVAGLDHLCTISLPPASPRARWIVRLFVTVLLWYLAALYVFLLSDFTPVLEDVSLHQMHQCWVFHTTQILQVVTMLLLTLGCAALHAVCKDHITNQTSTHSRRSVVCQVLCIFLSAWAPLLVFLAVLLLLLLLPAGMPSYLGLNVAWLCFLNSFLIAVVLCVVGPTSQFAQGLAAVPADSFCEWRIKFSLAAEDGT